MIQKKICMLGAFAVGKTSLTRRFVHSLYSDRYLSTVGVKIEKKLVTVGDRQLDLVIWDIQGEDEFGKVSGAYLRGASGYLYVADGTRGPTLDTALEIAGAAAAANPGAERILAVNKADLADAWAISPARSAELVRLGWTVVRTSAKSGEGVETTFSLLAEKLLAAHDA